MDLRHTGDEKIAQSIIYLWDIEESRNYQREN